MIENVAFNVQKKKERKRRNREQRGFADGTHCSFQITLSGFVFEQQDER